MVKTGKTFYVQLPKKGVNFSDPWLIGGTGQRGSVCLTPAPHPTSAMSSESIFRPQHPLFTLDSARATVITKQGVLNSFKSLPHRQYCSFRNSAKGPSDNFLGKTGFIS